MCFLLTDGYLEQPSGTGDSILGIYLSIRCALVGVNYLVMVKSYIQVYGPLRMTTYTFVLGFITLYPSIGMIWSIWVNLFDLFDRTHIEYMSIITLGVWNTCLAFILWLWVLSKIPDVARGNYFFLKPVIVFRLAFFILEDDMTINQLIGIFAITGFVMLEIFYDPISNFFKLNRN